MSLNIRFRRKTGKGSSFSLPKGNNSQLLNPGVQDFELLKVLGAGSFSKVYLARTVLSKRQFAMKVMSKLTTIRRRQVEHTLAEFRVLKNSDHPFICKLFYAFEDDHNLFLISEYCSGGELYHYLKTGKFLFSSKAIRFYAAEIILALEYLHGNNIIHRDIKPENIMFDALGHIRLIDFGLCKENVVGSSDGRTFCGTEAYMAPEMLYSKVEGRGHGKSVDFWGLGILMYELLYGWPPFIDKKNADNKKLLIENILDADPVFPKVEREVSLEAIALIKALLTKKPENRLGVVGKGIVDLKEHPFLALTKWKQLLAKKIKPPYKPNTKNQAENFDSKFTEAEVRVSINPNKVDEIDSEIFEDFFFSRDEEITKNRRVKRKTKKINLKEQLALSDPRTERKPREANFNEIEDFKYEKSKVALVDFEVMKRLGEGTLSKVFLIRSRTNRKEYFALKLLKKAEIIKKHQVEHTNAEYNILRRISHPFICNLYHAFESKTTIYFVSEFCEGGELHFHISNRVFFDEEIRFLCSEIFLALSFLHLKNVIYRDLKAENVMLDLNGHIRLIDFGCSKTNIKGFYEAKTFCGTPAYISPEMILNKSNNKGHGKSVDWWSYGILTYEMYYGRTPFYDKDIEKMYQNILNLTPIFPARENYIPEEGIELICGLLNKNPRDRLACKTKGFAELFAHSFFRDTNWELVSAKKAIPPYVPKTGGKIGNFDHKITNKEARLSVYEENINEDKRFVKFSYSRIDKK